MLLHTNCYPSFFRSWGACGVTLASKMDLLARNRVNSGVRLQKRSLQRDIISIEFTKIEKDRFEALVF